MHKPFRKILPPFAIALALTSLWLPTKTRAQTYPIDCAILLCLSGGWPASAPCSLARAEFIRRITPWPVEPPLQIWRCPMGASHETDRQSSGAERVIDVLFHEGDFRQSQSLPELERSFDTKSSDAIRHSCKAQTDLVQKVLTLRLTADRADIDISGPEFNFVRSIRVFDVRYASQRKVGENEQCRRDALVYLGTYGTQGEFAWAISKPTALPDAHVGLEGWGSNCPSLYNRSVFVDWQDYDGNYGFEQINY